METEAQSNIPSMVTSSDLQPQHSITTLAQASMFWRPHFLGDSPWVEHVPFAFWLVEAHQPKLLVEVGTGEGTSYFAFCQAVERLRLNAKCYSVKIPSSPDENGTAEKEQEERQQAIESHNEAFYSSFSSLLDGTPDQACQHFPDGSIDLLNLDGLHTVDQTKHLLEAWLPRLSRQGLVLLHGTNVRERGIQLYRVLQELSGQYPIFEFKHGRGLGVVATGSSQSALVNSLLEVAERSENVQVIQDVFSRLGNACADRYSVKATRLKVSTLNQELEALRNDQQQLVERLSDTEKALHKKAEEMALLQARIRQQVERQALERGQLVERSSLIESLYAELREDVKKRQADSVKTQESLQKKAEETVQLSIDKTNLDAKLNSLQQQIEADRQALQQRDRHTDELKGHIESLESGLFQERERSKKQSRQLEEFLAREKILKSELDTIREKCAADSEKQKEELKVEETRLRKLEAELLDEKNSLSLRFKELAELTILLEVRDKEIAELKTASATRDGRILELEEQIGKRDGQIRELHLQINALSKQNKVLQRLKELAEGRSRLTGRLSVDQESQKLARLIQKSGLFDVGYYLNENPDVARNREARSNPILHYVLVGALEGRNPSADFLTEWYLETYPDVTASQLNPLAHYILHGQSEGRATKPNLSPAPD